MDLQKQKVATHDPQPETSSETQGENQSNVEDKSNETLGESTTPVPEKALPENSLSSLPSADHSADAAVSAEENLKKVESETATVPNKEIQDIQLDTQSAAFLGEKERKSVPSPTTTDRPQVPFFLHTIFMLILISWTYRCYEILNSNRFYHFGIMPMQAIILLLKGDQMHFNIN